MGLITIEIPQDIYRHYEIASEEKAEEILLFLEQFTDAETSESESAETK